MAILVGAYYDPGAAMGAVFTGWKGVVGAVRRVPFPPLVGGGLCGNGRLQGWTSFPRRWSDLSICTHRAVVWIHIEGRRPQPLGLSPWSGLGGRSEGVVLSGGSAPAPLGRAHLA